MPEVVARVAAAADGLSSARELERAAPDELPSNTASAGPCINDSCSNAKS